MIISKRHYNKLNGILLISFLAAATVHYHNLIAIEIYSIHGGPLLSIESKGIVGGWSSESLRLDERQFIETHMLDFEGTNTSQSILPQNWYMDTTKTPRYVGGEQHDHHQHQQSIMIPRTRNNNTIQLYNHKGYQHCLANKTVVFIGDSRVRYQFMHLASFLHTQKRMKCWDYFAIMSDNNITFTPDPECLSINEGFQRQERKRGWTAWYQDSTDLLGTQSSLKENEANLCDCDRSEDKRYENRFIRRSTPFGDIHLIYIQTTMNLMTFNEDFPPFSSYAPSPKRCNTGECGGVNRNDVFEGNLNETLWKILPQLNATHAFVNVGWERAPGQDYSCELQEFEQNHPEIKTFMITTPPETKHLENDPYFHFPKNLKCKCNILDRTGMNKNVPGYWYWDRVHVDSILNEAYNDLAIQQICPIKN